ncbi:MAG: oxygen-dependent coproporphyrinogen oxidase [Flavitalea sp.]
MTIRDRFYNYIMQLQQTISAELEKADGKSRFITDKWERPEGGGGVTNVISGGDVFEKGGVNTSSVHGELPQAMRDAFSVNGTHFYACGLSLVIHPVNPFVPTVHANWRYFELYNGDEQLVDSWFGGGSDLTPYYIFEEDGRHFHTTLKNAMDGFGEQYYPKYKEQCDNYFINKHRNNEARGIGGVFYDYLRPSDNAAPGNEHEKNKEVEMLFNFQQANGNAFLPAYLPIVHKRKNTKYGEEEVEWQEIRRGRYTEFNLVHDRGTLFGLKTNGRIESILMSLPPRARWLYDHHPAPGSREAELMEYLKPRQWV